MDLELSGNRIYMMFFTIVEVAVTFFSSSALKIMLTRRDNDDARVRSLTFEADLL